MKKKIIFILLIFSNIYSKQNKVAQWTILTYIQANNDLNWWAYYSISHMQAGMQNQNGVNVLIQWDHIKTKQIRRYKIVPGEMELDSSFSKTKIKNHVNALVDSFNWAKEKYPAKKYMLILWNHGTGSLDYDETFKSCLITGRLLSYEKILNKKTDINLLKRGILVDDSKNTVFTNQNLFDALFEIKKSLGKKIDILVMDACFMQMLEVAYQVKDTSDYLIASQEYESGEGLPYGTFIYSLTMQMGMMNSLNLSKNIVSWYDAFYKNKKGQEWYTFSAIDLSLINNIKMNLDILLKNIEECKKLNEKNIYKIITQSRQSTHEFYWTEYIDLYSFYEELLENIKDYDQENKEDKNFNQSLLKLKLTLEEGKKIIKKAIVANAYGEIQKNAHGISIYYPIQDAIHSSYFKTYFDKDTNWSKFINEYKLKAK